MLAQTRHEMESLPIDQLEKRAKTERVRFRCDPTTVAQAEVLAEEEGLSLARWLRKQIRIAYRLHEKPD